MHFRRRRQRGAPSEAGRAQRRRRRGVASRRGGAARDPGIRPGAIDLSSCDPADTRSSLARVHRRHAPDHTGRHILATTLFPRTVVDLAAQVAGPIVAGVFDELRLVRRRLRVEDLRHEYELPRTDALSWHRCRAPAAGRPVDVPSLPPRAQRCLRAILSDPRLPRPIISGIPLVARRAAAGRRLPATGVASSRRTADSGTPAKPDFDAIVGGTTSPNGTATRSPASPPAAVNAPGLCHRVDCLDIGDRPRRDQMVRGGTREVVVCTNQAPDRAARSGRGVARWPR